MSIVRNALIVAALVVTGCAETDVAPEQARQAALPRTAPPPTTPPMTVRAHGLTAELPPGWQAASESLTPHLTDPREELAVGTYPLRYRQTDCAHMPGSALEALGARDAFVTLEERGLGVPDGAADFPSRPARFGPALGGRPRPAPVRRAPSSPITGSASATGAATSTSWSRSARGPRRRCSARRGRSSTGCAWIPASCRIGSRAARACERGAGGGAPRPG